MLRKRLILAAAFGLLAAGLAGCSSSSNAVVPTAPGPGTVNVYGTDAPGNVSRLVVELDSVTIYATSGSSVAPPAGGASSQVDLVAAGQTAPALFNTFTIDQGQYDCVAGTMTLMEFDVEDSVGAVQTCTSATNLPGNTINVPQLCLAGGFMVVDEGGSVDLVVDLPVIDGSYDAISGDCTLNFDFGNASTYMLP